MKLTTRSNFGLSSAVIILMAALAVPATAQPNVPLKGALQGNDFDLAFTNTTVTVLTVGTGIGTLLGQFTFTQTVVVDFTNGTSAGSARLVAANGDSITTAIAGSGVPTSTPNVFDITDVHTITGGTGRFAAAQGSFTVKRLASGVTFLTSGSFEGNITPPGAAH
jgi:hypothetical protein